MAAAYCNNKDVFLRAKANTPHIRIMDETIRISKNKNRTTTVCYEIQNNAGCEVWQNSVAASLNGAKGEQDGDDEYDHETFLQSVNQIASAIRAAAPNALYVEWEVNPCSVPSQN